MKWTFGTKIALGFGVTALALVIVAFLGYRTTKELIAGEGWVAHTQEVRRAISKAESLAVDAETNERGFALTGDVTFLEPYNQALAGAEKQVDVLRVLTSDNAAQQRRIETLRTQLAAVATRFTAVINQRRTTGIEATATTVASGVGRKLMVDLRTTLHEMDTDEAELLEARERDAASATSTATTVIAWGSVASLVLTLLIGLLLIRSLNRQIGSAVQQITSSSTELQAAANQQASGAREQATAMTEIATTITELLATSRQIAESAQRVSTVAGQTVTAARTGDTLAARANDASAGVRKQVDQIVGHMLDLGKKSQHVGAVLDIVAELAEQTNILAINATIEAAGAGESGRRFGVVADEIRKLADRVASSTKEIRGIVDGVRSAVNATIMATETGSKAVDAGNLQVSETAAAFRQIGGMIGTTTDAAREIELSTKQQTTAVEQVNSALGSVVQAARETEASATQTLQTSKQLTALSSELLRLVEA